MIAMQAPGNITQVRLFIAAVTYYCDIWPQRSHILAPLTNLTGKGACIWNTIHKQAFDARKAIMVEDVLFRYPDHNLPLHICTDVSDFQIGSVILQQNIPVAYYSCILSIAQQSYTTIEKELLLVVDTLQNYRSMLLGADIHICTDHCNLTCNTLTTQCVLHWCLFIEELHPTSHSITGVDNVVTDAISCVPIEALEGVDRTQPDVDSDYNAKLFSIKLDSKLLLECLLHHLCIPEEIVYPLDYPLLCC